MAQDRENFSTICQISYLCGHMLSTWRRGSLLHDLRKQRTAALTNEPPMSVAFWDLVLWLISSSASLFPSNGFCSWLYTHITFLCAVFSCRGCSLNPKKLHPLWKENAAHYIIFKCLGTVTLHCLKSHDVYLYTPVTELSSINFGNHPVKLASEPHKKLYV